MYYTDDSILPENMDPLIITVAPYGPHLLPGEAGSAVSLVARCTGCAGLAV